MKNNQRFSIERKNTHDPKWACGLFAVFPVENVTQAPSPSSPFHSSMSLLLQFSHRLSCVVVVYLVLATIYGRLLYGGSIPNVGGSGGSSGVHRGSESCVSLGALPRPPDTTRALVHLSIRIVPNIMSPSALSIALNQVRP